MMSRSRRDYLWVILFLIVFINGFEAGGYQASLWSIGKDFDLSMSSMGLFASMELFAAMLAPILLGRWADLVEKHRSISVMLCLQIGAAFTVLYVKSDLLFLLCIFFLGLTTGALQFIAIAAVADAYPVSGRKKVAYITTMYALGALLSPLLVDFYLRHGLNWRLLFGFLGACSVLCLAGMIRSGSAVRELPDGRSGAAEGEGKFILSAILLLCVIMCIYVGFENGFTFFVDTLFTDVLKASTGKFALSLFWAVMIPARFFVGYCSRHVKKILIASILMIPCIMLFLTSLSNTTLVLLLCIPLGFASGAIYPSVLTIMLPFAGKSTATATGMITSATGIGGVIFTAMTGFLADRWGMQAAMLILVSFFSLSLLSALSVIRLSDRRKTG